MAQALEDWPTTAFRAVIQRLLISGVPWLELIRTTLTPASSRARIWSGSSQEGPRVATILVRRMGALRGKSGRTRLKGAPM
jgi:hypothetical protein